MFGDLLEMQGLEKKKWSKDSLIALIDERIEKAKVSLTAADFFRSPSAFTVLNATIDERIERAKAQAESESACAKILGQVAYEAFYPHHNCNQVYQGEWANLLSSAQQVFQDMAEAVVKANNERLSLGQIAVSARDCGPRGALLLHTIASAEDADRLEARSIEVTIENLAIVREQKAKMEVLLERASVRIQDANTERALDLNEQWLADYEAWKSQNLGGNMKDSNG